MDERPKDQGEEHLTILPQRTETLTLEQMEERRLIELIEIESKIEEIRRAL